MITYTGDNNSEVLEFFGDDPIKINVTQKKVQTMRGDTLMRVGDRAGRLHSGTVVITKVSKQ